MLLLAFALSILLHLIGVRFVHWRLAVPVDVPESVTLSHIVITHIVRHTPPPHTPQPLPSASIAPKRKTPLNLPHITQHGRGPGAVMQVGSVTPTPSPTPAHLSTPVVAPSGGCVTQNAPAAVKSTPQPPDIPAIARQGAAKGGLVQIHVRLSEQGAVTDAGVQSSSGNADLDRIALEMAKQSVYSPALTGCKATASEYLYRVKFITPQ